MAAKDAVRAALKRIAELEEEFLKSSPEPTAMPLLCSAYLQCLVSREAAG